MSSSGKRKGGAEKRRDNNKKLLLNSSNKCLKIMELFSKSKSTNNISLTSTSNVSENVLLGKLNKIYLYYN